MDILRSSFFMYTFIMHEQKPYFSFFYLNPYFFISVKKFSNDYTKLLYIIYLGYIKLHSFNTYDFIETLRII